MNEFDGNLFKNNRFYRTLKGEIKQEKTGDFFEALNNILDGIDSQLNCMNEARAEMEAEYYSEMMSNMDFY